MNKDIRLAKRLLESKGYKVVREHAYDETDIIVYDNPKCTPDDIVHVAGDDKDAVEYIKSEGIHGLFVKLPEADKVMTAEEYLEIAGTSDIKLR